MRAKKGDVIWGVCSERFFTITPIYKDKLRAGHCAIYYAAVNIFGEAGWPDTLEISPFVLREMSCVQSTTMYERWFNDLLRWDLFYITESTRFSSQKVNIIRPDLAPYHTEHSDNRVPEKAPDPRSTKEYRAWQKAVIKRDVVCQKCGFDEHLETHHIKPIATHPELITDVNNGQLLCKDCHKEMHKTRSYASK